MATESTNINASADDNLQFRAGHSYQLALRPLVSGDIALVERWMQERHIAKWFTYPEHWLNELRERHGEYSFLKHFIAEFDGIPIGFCQYYDTFYSQEHEVWNDEWNVPEKQGKVFSMDYMVGETEYLRHGFGREMIAQMLGMLQQLGAETVIVQPEKENTASNRALEANGFTFNGSEYQLNL